MLTHTPQSTGLFFEQFRESQTPVCLQPLEDILSKQPFLTGDTISAADIAVGSNLLYLPMFVPDVRDVHTIDTMLRVLTTVDQPLTTV